MSIKGYVDDDFTRLQNESEMDFSSIFSSFQKKRKKVHGVSRSEVESLSYELDLKNHRPHIINGVEYWAPVAPSLLYCMRAYDDLVKEHTKKPHLRRCFTRKQDSTRFNHQTSQGKSNFFKTDSHIVNSLTLIENNNNVYPVRYRNEVLKDKKHLYHSNIAKIIKKD